MGGGSENAAYKKGEPRITAELVKRQPSMADYLLSKKESIMSLKHCG